MCEPSFLAGPLRSWQQRHKNIVKSSTPSRLLLPINTSSTITHTSDDDICSNYSNRSDCIATTATKVRRDFAPYNSSASAYLAKSDKRRLIRISSTCPSVPTTVAAKARSYVGDDCGGAVKLVQLQLLLALLGVLLRLVRRGSVVGGAAQRGITISRGTTPLLPGLATALNYRACSSSELICDFL